MGKRVLGLHVVQASKHKTQMKGKAGIVINEDMLHLVQLYIDDIRPHIANNTTSPFFFLTWGGHQLDKLSARAQKVFYNKYSLYNNN